MQGYPICPPEDDHIWRVAIDVDGGVSTEYIGLCPVDSRATTHYSTLSDAPEWIQDRVAVLRMMPPDPNTSAVRGVGRRVDEDTFWVLE